MACSGHFAVHVADIMQETVLAIYVCLIIIIIQYIYYMHIIMY